MALLGVKGSNLAGYPAKTFYLASWTVIKSIKMRGVAFVFGRCSLCKLAVKLYIFISLPQ